MGDVALDGPWTGAIRGVRTLDGRAVRSACGVLRDAILAEGAPDVLIGIGTGGGRVAQELRTLSGGAWPVLTLGLRRPSTGAKVRYQRVGRLLARLPVPVRDRLRLWEHRRLTRDPAPGSAVAPTVTDARDVEAIAAWCAGAGATPRIVVVDDAVDTGATLARALELIAGAAPAGSVIRTAAITVTPHHPIVVPDHVVIRGWLCRFPWSMDA